jgi:hypothetical protein
MQVLHEWQRADIVASSKWFGDSRSMRRVYQAWSTLREHDADFIEFEEGQLEVV